MKKIIAALGLIGTIALPSADAMMVKKVSAKDDVYAPVVVESKYEVANGFNGMMRDVIIRLMGIICDDEKVRQILGMNYEIYAFKNHAYFQDFYQKPMLLSIELYHAACFEDSDAVTSLIKRGAKANSRIDNSTPLHFAVQFDKIRNVEVLLANKADPNAKNVAPRGNGRTPLHEAVRCSFSNSIEIMKKLLSTPGIRVDELDGNGNTALHIVVWYNETRAIEILLDVGHANINAKNAEGKTPMDWAYKSYARVCYDGDSHSKGICLATLNLLKSRHAKYGYEVK
ncbi:hypothetical protein FACS1894122_06730 [Alphaproteobacteria bacterium]|nr:hypothetical protein FACS1894122_06730 [Alphaproteobacteria bacterium]